MASLLLKSIASVVKCKTDLNIDLNIEYKCVCITICSIVMSPSSRDSIIAFRLIEVFTVL